jgi:hypothetical protein
MLVNFRVLGTICALCACLGASVPATADDTDELQKAKHDYELARLKAKNDAKIEKLKRKTAGAGITVLLDAKTGWQSNSRIRLEEGQAVSFRIMNTSRECYTFNFAEVAKTQAQGDVDVALPHNDTVDFQTIHVDTTSAYEIMATRKADSTEAQCPFARTWHIAVVPSGWELGFAGAYTVDKLTDPAFALRAGTGANAGLNEVVVEDKQDSWEQGAAAMVHLYHSDAFGLGKGVSWAPLSFGLGLASTENANYYLGTGLKFGKQAFLTAGIAVGSRDDLGQGIEEGDFIAQPNLPLESRTDSAFFVGISFSFLNANISQRLEAPFNVEAPKPEKSAKTDTDSGGQPGPKALGADSANVERLNEHFKAVDPPARFVITAVSDIKKTGDLVDSLTVEFELKDGTKPTQQDVSEVETTLHNGFKKTTFKAVPKK